MRWWDRRRKNEGVGKGEVRRGREGEVGLVWSGRGGRVNGMNKVM